MLDIYKQYTANRLVDHNTFPYTIGLYGMQMARSCPYGDICNSHYAVGPKPCMRTLLEHSQRLDKAGMAPQANELGHPKAAHTLTVKEATKDECPICFEHVKPVEVMTTVQCQHWLHSSCLTIWRKKGQKELVLHGRGGENMDCEVFQGAHFNGG